MNLYNVKIRILTFYEAIKLAIRLRVIPKILKKSSQMDLASASSELSLSHCFENAIDRLLISFQLSGMVLPNSG
jgi:hypothetical protein